MDDTQQQGQVLDELDLPFDEAALDGILDEDPTLLDDLDAAGVRTTTPAPPGEKRNVAGFWQSLGRGALGAVDELSNTVVGVGAGITKHTGLYKAVNDEEGEQDFLHWYEQRTNEVNPLQFGEDRKRRWLGERADGANGFVEGLAQFVTGFAATGAALKGVGAATKAASLGWKGKLGYEAAKGAVVDLSFFNPYEERLSNMVEQGPSWVSNPLTRLLQAKDDDTEAEGRVKQALEGIVLGTTIDGLIRAAKFVRLKQAGKLDEATRFLDEWEMDASDVDDAMAPRFRVEPTGKGWVVRTGGKQGPAVLLDGAPVDDPRIVKAGAPASNGDGLTVVEQGGYQRKLAADAAAEAEKRWIEWTRKYPKDAVGLSDEEIAERKAQFRKRIEQEQRNAAHTDGALPELGEGKVAAAADVREPSVGSVRVKDRRVAARAAAESPVFRTQGEAEAAAASMEYAAKHGTLAPAGTSPETVDTFRALLTAIREGADERTVEQLRDAYGVNVKYVGDPVEVFDTIKAAVETDPVPSTAMRNRPVTLAEIEAQSEGIFKDVPTDQIVRNLLDKKVQMEQMPAFITASREYLQSVGKKLNTLARKADAYPDDAGAVDQLAVALDHLLEVHAYVTGISSDVGRSLVAHQIPVGEALEVATKQAAKAGDEALPAASKNADEAMDPAVVAEAKVSGAETTGVKGPQHRAPGNRKATAGLTRTEIRALARQVLLTEGDAAAALALIRGPKTRAPKGVKPRKWYDYVISYRMEALLSGPKTSVVNVLNNAIVALQRPVEYWWAGARGGDDALKNMGTDMLGGLTMENMRESWLAFGKAFRQGQNILDPSHTHTGSNETFLKPWEETGALMRIGHLPSRFLMASDEFFKQMNYRMNVRAQILKQARDAGITDPKELADRLKTQMQFSFDPDGGATSLVGAQYAEVTTFTNDLREGSLGWHLQRYANEHPWAKIVAPFIRTPANIFNYAWERTPLLNRASRQFREELASPDPRVRQLAVAKSELGGMIWTTGAILAASGAITGKGPTDPELRQVWLAAGNQPYAFKVPGTNRWVSYRRTDPTFASLSMIADLVTISGELSQRRDVTWERMVGAVIASFASSLTSKSYLQGITDFMEAMTNGERYGTALVNNLAGSFVPNILRQANGDEYIRETRTMLDEVMSRVPGYSERLEPRRNLFGEKVMYPPGGPGDFNRSMNPFTIGHPMDDAGVAAQLVELGRAFTMPEETWDKGMPVDLTDRAMFSETGEEGQSPYDYMLSWMAAPTNGMSPLKERLHALMQTPAWQQASTGDPTIAPGGARWLMAASVIEAYQAAARGAMLQKYPKLRETLVAEARLKGAALRGGTAAVTDVMAQHEALFK